MAKISQTHHITRRGVVKRNPRKINRTLQEQAQYDRASSNSVYDTKLRELMDMGWSYGAAHRVALADDISSSNKEKRCKSCGKKLSTSDYGYYCSNEKCKLFDQDILAYER